MRTTMTAVDLLAARRGEIPEPRVIVVTEDQVLLRALAPFGPVVVGFDELRERDLDPIDVAVLDRRSCETGALETIAQRIPVLLVGRDVADTEVAHDAHAIAAEHVDRPLDLRVLEGRLRLLAELRRLRRAMVIIDAALRHSRNGLAIADPRRHDLPLIYVSPAFERLTGYDAEEVVGLNCRFLQGPDPDPEVAKRLRDAIREGRPERVVLQNQRKDGTPFWNELTLFPIADERGRVLYLGGVQHDVTEVLEARAAVARARDEIAESHAFTLAVLDGLSVAVLTCDAQLHVNFVNRAAARLFGQEPAWFAGRLLGDALGMPTAPLREERSFEWTFTRADGRVRELGVSVQPSGPPESRDLLVVFHDLTETQQAERVARLAAVSTMAAGFAHEVRNPLANVRMFAELLVAELSRDDERRQLVDRLMGQVNRIERLVRTSLQFARPERPRRGRHWPSLIANATLEALSPRTRKMGGELLVEVQAELPKVVCDDGQLVQVLVGLINNALDATSDPARVTLRIVDGAREGERAVLFKVIDDGPGIPDGLRQEIFNPFFTTKASGTGLGLSIAQQVIHENGGRIELSSTDGGGATFVVVVPAETP